MLVSGEAPACPWLCTTGSTGIIDDITLAEGLVVDALDHLAVAVGDGIHITQSIFVQVARLVRGFAAILQCAYMDGDQLFGLSMPSPFGFASLMKNRSRRFFHHLRRCSVCIGTLTTRLNYDMRYIRKDRKALEREKIIYTRIVALLLDKF